MAAIYGLFDANGELRYIGKANDPKKRLASHMRDARRRDTPVYRWIRKNGAPILEVLEDNCEDWKASERRLIAEARSRGDKLLNVADGGDEPLCPIEVRRENGRKSSGPTGYLSQVKNDKFIGLVHGIKRDFSASLRLFERRGDQAAAERMKQRMRGLAEKLPDHFPKWINI